MRLATYEDYPRIEKALRWMALNSTAPKMKNINEDKALDYVSTQIVMGNVLITNGCLVMGEPSQSWFSDDKLFIEDLFIAFDKTYNIQAAIEDLVLHAKSLGCCEVVVGDTQIGLMIPHYEAAGFTRLGTQLHRRI